MGVEHLELTGQQGNLRMRKMSFETIIGGETFCGTFYPNSLDVTKYVLITFYLTFANQTKLKEIKTAQEIIVHSKLDFEEQMFRLIASPDNKNGTLIFESKFTGPEVENQLLGEIRRVLRYWEQGHTGKKLVFYVTITNSCIPQEIGHTIATMIPLPKPERSIIFEYLKNKTVKNSVGLTSFILNHGT